MCLQWQTNVSTTPELGYFIGGIHNHWVDLYKEILVQNVRQHRFEPHDDVISLRFLNIFKHYKKYNNNLTMWAQNYLSDDT